MHQNAISTLLLSFGGLGNEIFRGADVIDDGQSPLSIGSNIRKYPQPGTEQATTPGLHSLVLATHLLGQHAGGVDSMQQSTEEAATIAECSTTPE